jgi:hypothetical protein
MGLRRRVLTEKLAQDSRTGLLWPMAQGHLHGFQIERVGLAPFGENHSQQRIYFPRDFLMDRSGRFFFCAVQPAGSCSPGRSPQIFSLTATSSALSF